MDSKYGKLYPESDLRMIVQMAMERDITSEDQLDEILDELSDEDRLTFPVDEPLFLLRGQDKAAAAAIDAYGEICSERGANQDHLEAIGRASNKFDAWADDNPNRMKVAD